VLRSRPTTGSWRPCFLARGDLSVRAFTRGTRCLSAAITWVNCARILREKVKDIENEKSIRVRVRVRVRVRG